eukprot:Sspe_Gene.27711::Locus_12081_Transcript_2_5_Confidence_0.636_Length_661::g.27711::m.27711
MSHPLNPNNQNMCLLSVMWKHVLLASVYHSCAWYMWPCRVCQALVSMITLYADENEKIWPGSVLNARNHLKTYSLANQIKDMKQQAEVLASQSDLPEKLIKQWWRCIEASHQLKLRQQNNM